MNMNSKLLSILVITAFLTNLSSSKRSLAKEAKMDKKIIGCLKDLAKMDPDFAKDLKQVKKLYKKRPKRIRSMKLRRQEEEQKRKAEEETKSHLEDQDEIIKMRNTTRNQMHGEDGERKIK